MMKKAVLLLLSILLTVPLCGCGGEPAETEPTQTIPTTLSEPETTEPETTVPETTEPETTVPETTVPEETEPEHSALYIPGLDVEDLLLYFNEVCLDSEFTNGGDPTRVQKWIQPIQYAIEGDPTDEDLEVLEGFTQWLNTVEGFPGIGPSDTPENANLRIHFTDQENLLDILGSDYTDVDGGVTFWYENDEIFDAVICIRTDLDQYLRNSVILEEIYNGLGPVQDTLLRSDSIIYQEYSEPQTLTETDELILKLLYHPGILCGMDAQDCENVIRELYY